MDLVLFGGTSAVKGRIMYVPSPSDEEIGNTAKEKWGAVTRCHIYVCRSIKATKLKSRQARMQKKRKRDRNQNEKEKKRHGTGLWWIPGVISHLF